MLRGMTLQDVLSHLGVSWDTVKEIHCSYLKCHYSPSSLDGVEKQVLMSLPLGMGMYIRQLLWIWMVAGSSMSVLARVWMPWSNSSEKSGVRT